MVKIEIRVGDVRVLIDPGHGGEEQAKENPDQGQGPAPARLACEPPSMSNPDWLGLTPEEEAILAVLSDTAFRAAKAIARDVGVIASVSDKVPGEFRWTLKRLACCRVLESSEEGYRLRTAGTP